MQFIDVASILLKYCVPKADQKGETQAVIVDLVATLGFFCANNKHNQVSSYVRPFVRSFNQSPIRSMNEESGKGKYEIIAGSVCVGAAFHIHCGIISFYTFPSVEERFLRSRRR